jgi:hypothetical protein
VFHAKLLAASVLLALAFCFGCGKDSATGPGSSAEPTPTFRLTDFDYAKGVYYFLYDPNLDQLQINNFDIMLFLDDYNTSNNHNAVPGRAFMDAGLTGGPTGAYGDPAASDTTSVRGMFQVLYPGDDYETLDLYGPHFKMVRLNRQIVGDQMLAVTYQARRIGPGGPLQPFQVGGLVSTESDGVDRLYMKLLRPPVSQVRPDPSGYYSRDSIFALTRDLELKNFYFLPGQLIDPATFQLAIRKGVDDPPVTSIPHPGGTSVPYLEAIGLDSYDESGGAPVPGHDGKVDGTYLTPASQQTFVDFDKGILFLPDPRPFAPRVSPGGAPPLPFDQAVSNALVRRDSLTGAPGTANEPNVAIYDKHNPNRALDTMYYIDVQFTAASGAGGVHFGFGNLLRRR